MSTSLQALCDGATPEELRAAVDALFLEWDQRLAAHPKGMEILSKADDLYSRNLLAKERDRSLYEFCTCPVPAFRAFFLVIGMPNSRIRTQLKNIMIRSARRKKAS